MPLPTITDAPDPPLRSEAPTLFSGKAETFVEWWSDTFVPELQALITALNAYTVPGAYSPGGDDVAVADGGTGASTAAGARTNLAAAAQSQTGEGISGLIETPSNKDYRIVVKAPHGGTITETTTVSASGTCTATFKVNTTALGGTANSVSSSEQSQAHASSNTFAAGDDIVITISSNSSCADMSFTIKYTRTLA